MTGHSECGRPRCESASISPGQTANAAARVAVRRLESIGYRQGRFAMSRYRLLTWRRILPPIQLIAEIAPPRSRRKVFLRARSRHSRSDRDRRIATTQRCGGENWIRESSYPRGGVPARIQSARKHPRCASAVYCLGDGLDRSAALALRRGCRRTISIHCQQPCNRHQLQGSAAGRQIT